MVKGTLKVAESPTKYKDFLEFPKGVNHRLCLVGSRDSSNSSSVATDVTGHLKGCEKHQ